MLGVVKKPKSTRNHKVKTNNSMINNSNHKTFITEPDTELIADDLNNSGYWVTKGEDYW